MRYLFFQVLFISALFLVGCSKKPNNSISCFELDENNNSLILEPRRLNSWDMRGINQAVAYMHKDVRLVFWNKKQIIVVLGDDLKTICVLEPDGLDSFRVANQINSKTD